MTPGAFSSFVLIDNVQFGSNDLWRVSGRFLQRELAA